jgi:hypothetical protein
VIRIDICVCSGLYKKYSEQIRKRAPGKKTQVDEYLSEVGKVFSRQRSLHDLSIHLSDLAQQLNGFSWEYKAHLKA